MFERLFRAGMSDLNHFFCKISMFDIWRLNLCDRFLPGCSHLTAGRLFLQTMSKFILISGITRFRNYSFQEFRNFWFCPSLCKRSYLAPGGVLCYIISQMNTYIINKILPRMCLALLTACRHLWQLHLVVLKFIQRNDTRVVPCEKVSQNVDPSEKRFFVTNYQ